MTIIGAVVNPDRASVALHLVPSDVVTGIIRHDSNGIRPVRVRAGTFPTSSPVQVDDWEASLAGKVTYSVGDLEAPVTVTLAGTGPWLTPPLVPSASVPLGILLGYDASRASSTSVTDLASGGAVVKLGSMGTRTGKFAVLCESHAVAAHLEDLLARHPQQLLRVPEHSALDLYFLTRDTAISVNTDTGLWELAVSYTETPPPVDGLPTWTYSALARAYADLGSAGAAYKSLAGLAANNRSA